MDPIPTTRQRKQQLIQRLADSRLRIEHDRDRLRDYFNPLRRLRSAVKQHPFRTFGFAAGGAFILSLLRRRSSSRPTSAKRLLLRWAFGLAKPAIRLWILNQARERLLSSDQPASNEYQAITP
jgi:hypothetical protein